MSGWLHQSAREHILATLPYDRGDARTGAALAAMPLPELMIVFINWRTRFVTPRPRQLRVSDCWLGKAQGVDSTVLTNLMSEIEQGADLTARLSRRVAQGFALAKSDKKRLGPTHRPDLDMLLNDWGIHHLHIGPRKPDGGVEPGPLLAFVIFRSDTAYLIGICDHQAWASREMAEAIIRNWPNSGFFAELSGILPGNGFTEEELLNLRNVGVITPVVVDRKVFVPPNALSMAGTNVMINREAAHVLRTLWDFETNYDARVSTLRAQLAKSGLSFPEAPTFEFRFFLDGFGLHETTHKIDVGLGRWTYVH